MNSRFRFEEVDEGVSRCRILVAAVGGGGCNVVGRILHGWEDPPTIAAVNTDAQALAACPIDLKVQLGRVVAKGMGTGGNPELGHLAANEDIDALRSLVSGYDLLILVTCLGGGTGTSAAPVLVKLAREEGLLSLVFATLPFDFEGERRQQSAEEGLAALKDGADAVITLPNQRLHSMMEPGTTLVDAFAFVNRMLAAGIRSLWSLLAKNNMLNLDFSDLQTLVEHSRNVCVFGYGEGEGEQKAEQALAELLEGPMLDKGRVIANSGAMILKVTGGRDLSLLELNLIHSRFRDAARPGAQIFTGAAVLDDWAGRIALTVLAAEHWMPPPLAGTSGGLLMDLNQPEKTASAKSEKKKRKGKDQPRLPLAAASAGDRFKGVPATKHKGADLDTPTYIRQHIRLH